MATFYIIMHIFCFQGVFDLNKPVSLQKMTMAAMLIAVGIAIPIFSPAKVILEPASFTLASHVPVFLSMFISPAVAIVVALGTTLGFFLGGFPIVVVLRAATHIIFAVIGSIILQKHPKLLLSTTKTQIFSFFIAIVHALGELCVVSIFYFGGDVGASYYNQGFVTSVLLLVGLGSVVHSMIDFTLSLGLLKVLNTQKSFSELFSKQEKEFPR